MQPESQEDLSPLKQIRTFQGDIAEALKHKGESVVSLTNREKVKRETALEPPARKSPEPQAASTRAPVITETAVEEGPRVEHHWVRTTLLILGTLILLGGGGYGGWYAYTQYKVKTALPVITVLPNQFVTPQTIFDINAGALNRDSLVNAIRTERGANIPSGAITQIELRESQGQSADLVTTERFLVHYLLAQAPGSLIRAFDPLFTLGVLGPSPGEASGHTFVVIKLDSFQNAFPGMLNWEPTMATDILPLFASDSELSAAASSTAFTDITIQNKDARVLKDIAGKIILLYSFYDNNYLIITDNPLSLRQIITALDARKVVR